MPVKAPPTKIDRHQTVLRLIRDNDRVSLAELERVLDVTRITIQRDLVELDERGLLRRFHGGAMSVSLSENLRHHDVRKKQNVAAKKRMAQKAVKLIRTGMYVGLDASSSAYYLSELPLPENIFAITNNQEIFANLSRKPGVKAVLTGGRTHPQIGTLVGPEAIHTIREFHFDACFISAESYQPNIGFVESIREEVEVKRAIIAASSLVVMMVDSTKVGKTGGIKVCNSRDVSRLIMDGKPDSAIRREFKGRLL